VTIETIFLPRLHFLGCTAQRSLHVITNVYYRSMSYFAIVSWTNGPRLQCKGFPHKPPLLHHVIQAGHKVWCHSHSTKHDTQPIAYLISKRVIPYWTRGGTYCSGVSTPKIRSLADLSMTNHITWRIPTISTIPTYAQTTASILTTTNSHLDGWMITTLTQRHKPYSTSQRMKDLHDTNDCMIKHN
jgi:hypothetical protein